MKRYNKTALMMGFLLLFISMKSNLSGCTSFACYFDKVYYGMNFDYPDVELKFSISKTNTGKRFLMSFKQGSGFGSTAGVNDQGLFSAEQMLYPEQYNSTPKQADELYLWDVFNYSTINCQSVEQIKDFIDGKTVRQAGNICLHDIVADKYGGAMVVEPGNNDNALTDIEDDFIVMTNFRIADFANSPYNQVSGPGAERYKTAYEYINQNRNSFGYENGIETLRRTIQSSGGYPTQCSMLFDPAMNEVFIALKGDFSKIWKVSIDQGIIESYSGFSKQISMEMGASGVLASLMSEIASTENMPTSMEGLINSYPNPFNKSTILKYRISKSGPVSIKLYNAQGEVLKNYVNKDLQANEYELTISANDIQQSGIYYCVLETNNTKDTRKIVFEK
ncbi:T9SS type A sorting domain-containing protein [Bacteroidota bacterium]